MGQLSSMGIQLQATNTTKKKIALADGFCQQKQNIRLKLKKLFKSQTSKEGLAAQALKPGEGENSQAATANVLRNKPLDLASSTRF